MTECWCLILDQGVGEDGKDLPLCDCGHCRRNEVAMDEKLCCECHD